MFVCSVLYIAGVICVRLTSFGLTLWDPFNLIEDYSALRNITTDTPSNEYNNLYFEAMCNFFSVTFTTSYVGMTVPTATLPWRYHVYIDTCVTFFVMFGLQATFFFGRYCYKIVLIASAFGAFWGFVLVNIVDWTMECYSKIAFKRVLKCCAECCEKHGKAYSPDSPAAEPLTRHNVYVF